MYNNVFFDRLCLVRVDYPTDSPGQQGPERDRGAQETGKGTGGTEGWQGQGRQRGQETERHHQHPEATGTTHVHCIMKQQYSMCLCPI